MNKYLHLLIILLIGYAVGIAFPGPGSQLKAKIGL